MTSTVPAAGELSETSVLDALLRPRGVAMIGASRNPTALGGRPLGALARYGFPGQVYPVNGSAPEVQGVPSYASVKDIPGPVDLALVMVRSGFGEGMGAGAGMLESLAPELAASGMRV